MAESDLRQAVLTYLQSVERPVTLETIRRKAKSNTRDVQRMLSVLMGEELVEELPGLENIPTRYKLTEKGKSQAMAEEAVAS